MTEPAEKNELPVYENVDTTPFIYFDISPAHRDHGWRDPNRTSVPHLERGVRRKRRNQIYNQRPFAMQSDGCIKPAQRDRCRAEDVGRAAARAGGNDEAELKARIYPFETAEVHELGRNLTNTRSYVRNDLTSEGSPTCVNEPNQPVPSCRLHVNSRSSPDSTAFPKNAIST